MPLLLPLLPNKLTTGKLKSQGGLHVRSVLFKPDSARVPFGWEALPGLTPAGISPWWRVSPQAWYVMRRFLALEKKAQKLMVTPAREAAFLTKQKPFLSVSQEVGVCVSSGGCTSA